jgi:hypothetical protein
MKKLSKKDYLNVNVQQSCEFLTHPPEPLALRLTSNLMLGITRVFYQQYQFHYLDVQSLWASLSHYRTGYDQTAVINLPPNEV